MPPQLPEHALVTLLRQCYMTPRCQLRPRSQVRSVHLIRQYQRISRSSYIARRRGFQTHDGGIEDGKLDRAHLATPTNARPASEPGRKDIAILGGGITGLSAAHYITRELPAAKVTIYEASDRLGGWLQSQSVNVGNGDIVFESGPRTLRPHTPAGMATVEMVRSLPMPVQAISDS